MKNNSLLKKVVFFLFVFLGIALFMAIFYISRNFAFVDSNPLAQILFHVLVQTDGADPVFIRGIVIQIIVFPLACALIATYVLFSNSKFVKKIQNIKFIKIVSKYAVLLSIVFFVISFICISKQLELKDYIEKYTKSSTLYEDEYIDPKNIDYSFPNKKRNLIYIYLESVETSDYSIEQGGGSKYCYIPELYELANNNVTFNNNQGFSSPPNTSWTVAALVGQSAGIPLDLPIDANEFVTSNKYLPGAYAIGDILEDNGYKNILFMGQVAEFGGVRYFYEKHGNYDIRDYNYAVDKGLVEEGDFVWWGYEDYRLFDYAKDELLQLANSEQPFNFTMFTIDTHNNDGWICKYCEDEFDEQLGNVYACSSRLVNNFVEWCKQQEFYENTTIVLAGDHCSMDTHFTELLSGHDRKVYFTVINQDASCVETKNRVINTFDLFPTTLSSLGVKFDGNRLGLGTNLFSTQQTLSEKYGEDEFFSLVKKNSTYYNNHILYGIE